METEPSISVTGSTKASGVATENKIRTAASSAVAWLKDHWTLFPLLVFAVDFYWILWGNLTAIVVGIVLLGVLSVDMLALKRTTLPTLKRYWPAVALLAIISLSMYIRLFGYFLPDGSTRWPYLRNIDSYYFLRYTEDILNNQMALPPHEDLVMAPYGASTAGGRRVYEHLSAYSYAAANAVYPQPLETFMAWWPALLASLIAVPSYFIGKSLFDRKAGALSALFMVFATPFMSRSLGGDPDSDCIVMLLMLATIATFTAAHKVLDKSNRISPRLVASFAATGAVLGLFALTWAGYVFAFMLIFAFLAIKLVASLFLRLKSPEFRIKPKVVAAATGVALAVFWAITVPYFTAQFALEPFIAPLKAGLGGEAKGEAGIFPNVGVSVAEMQAGGDARDVAVHAAGLDVAAGISGLPLGLLTIASPFLITLACFVYLGYSYYKRRAHLDTLLFMGLWFIGFLFASIIAVRFTIFLAPVYAICSGIMLAKLWRVATGEDRSLGA
ncbi:MAG: STT3 domain-containing protein [Candidatus Aenigmatarchaeota archaeon]